MWSATCYENVFPGKRLAPAPRATIADQWYNPGDLLLRVLLRNHKIDRDPLV
jgi:hypothetical protein